jgi:hypothetical protein
MRRRVLILVVWEWRKRAGSRNGRSSVVLVAFGFNENLLYLSISSNMLSLSRFLVIISYSTILP